MKKLTVFAILALSLCASELQIDLQDCRIYEVSVGYNAELVQEALEANRDIDAYNYMYQVQVSSTEYIKCVDEAIRIAEKRRRLNVK